MAWQTFRLIPRPGSGFHFGRQGHELETSVETFPSDSLFGAIVTVYRELFGDVAEFLYPWEIGQPPFVLSSVFPYVGDLPLFPMPRLRVNLEPVPGRRKRLKNLKYVSPTILNHLLNGDAMDNYFGDDGPAVSLQNGSIWLDASEIDALPSGLLRSLPRNPQRQALALRSHSVWHSEPVPRVTIDRITNSSNIYQVGRTVFADGCGLWVLADIHDRGQILESLLADLGIRGIGGERNSGYGAFSLGEPFAEITLPPPGDAARVMTLSRYHPRYEELAANVLRGGASYELVTVGGWLASPNGKAQRRRRVRMIEAGSVLEHTTPILGQLVDVRPVYEAPGAPPHPVYRNGYALTIGATAEQEETI